MRNNVLNKDKIEDIMVQGIKICLVKNSIVTYLECRLGWDERETSLIMCSIHYYAYIDAGLNTAADDFIKTVASPKGSHYSHEILQSLR